MTELVTIEDHHGTGGVASRSSCMARVESPL
jgi:hypothetical protein